MPPAIVISPGQDRVLVDSFGRPLVDGADAIMVDDLDDEALYAMAVLAAGSESHQPGGITEALLAFARSTIAAWDERTPLERQLAFERGRDDLVKRGLLEIHGVDPMTGQSVITVYWRRLVVRGAKLDS